MREKVTLCLLGFLISIMMAAGVFVTGAFAMGNHSDNEAGSGNQSHTQAGHDSGNMGQSGSNGSSDMGNMDGMDMHGMDMNMNMDGMDSHDGSSGSGGHGGSSHGSGGHSGSGAEANIPPNWPFIYTFGAINLLVIIAAALMKKNALKGNGVS